jgi:hypothetical protein
VVTKGTGSGYLINNGAGYAIGDTAITVDTGSGTILAGDVITFAGDTNKYVVATALAANVVTLAAPGLRAAHADNDAITVGNNFTNNVAFTENALVLAARAPAAPEGGDMADDVQMVTDPVSGISFEIRLYREYRRIRYEVALAWGVGLVKAEDIAILLGYTHRHYADGRVECAACNTVGSVSSDGWRQLLPARSRRADRGRSRRQLCGLPDRHRRNLHEAPH